MSAPMLTNRDALAVEVAARAHAIAGLCLPPATNPDRRLYLAWWHEQRAANGADPTDTARLAPVQRVGLVLIEGGR